MAKKLYRLLRGTSVNISDKYLLLLLQIIKGNGDVRSLLSVGYDYYQIAQLINHAKSEGYIVSKDGAMELSEAGDFFIQDINKKMGRYDAESWISPAYSKQIEKIKEEEIYIPKRKKIRKLF